MNPAWMRVETFKEKITVVDLGYLNDPETESRYLIMKNAKVGRRNFQTQPQNRFVVVVPEQKMKKIAHLLVAGRHYFGTTHYFKDSKYMAWGATVTWQRQSQR